MSEKDVGRNYWWNPYYSLMSFSQVFMINLMQLDIFGSYLSIHPSIGSFSTFNICQTFPKFPDLIGILLRRMCHLQGTRISSGHYSIVLFLPHYLNCWLVLPEPLVFFLVWERLRLAFSFAAKFPRTLKLYLNFITLHQVHNIRI